VTDILRIPNKFESISIYFGNVLISLRDVVT